MKPGKLSRTGERRDLYDIHAKGSRGAGHAVILDLPALTTLMVANTPEMMELNGISGEGSGQEVAGTWKLA